MNEGQDVRLFRFSKSEDGTIKGSHKDLQNLDYWQVGCLGITAPCSEVSFKILPISGQGNAKICAKK